jgi:hypothetical protein
MKTNGIMVSFTINEVMASIVGALLGYISIKEKRDVIQFQKELIDEFMKALEEDPHDILTMSREIEDYFHEAIKNHPRLNPYINSNDEKN